MGGVLTTKITPLCQDDLLSDGPPMIDSASSCMHPLDLPSFYDYDQSFAKLPYFLRPSTKIPQHFLIGPDLKIPSSKWRWERQNLHLRLVR